MSKPLVIEVSDALVEVPQAELLGGFTASYFDVDHSLEKVDDIDWDSAPTHQEIVQDINYEKSTGSFWEGGSTDTFGAKLEGEITIEEGGTYTFFASGDDGVIVFVDGEPVVNNDGLHSFKTGSGEVELAPGTYDIEVRYFENYGNAGLRLEWDGPDTNGRELVKPDITSHIEENGTFSMGLNVESASPDTTVTLEGLPADTILHLGDTSIVADGGPIDVTEADGGLLEISPPPGFEGVIEGQVVVEGTASNGVETNVPTPFSFTVGDVETPRLAQEYDESLLVQTETKSETWTDDPDLSEVDLSDDDVLSEPTPMVQVDDVLTASTETYERVDW